MGDQQEGDKYTGEPCLCHRCFAPRKRHLDTDEDFEVKTMRKVRQRVEIAAAGGFMKGSNRQRIVKWDPDGRNVCPGQVIITFISFISIMSFITVMYIISFIHNFQIEYHFDIQEHDFMSCNELRPEHICSSMRSG